MLSSMQKEAGCRFLKQTGPLYVETLKSSLEGWWIYWSDERCITNTDLCNPQEFDMDQVISYVKVVSPLNYLLFIVANERQSHAICCNSPAMKPVVCSFAPSSGCLLLCLCLSVLTMLLQNLWMPLDIPRDDATGRSPQEQGNVRTEFVLHCGFCSHKRTQINSTLRIRNTFLSQHCHCSPKSVTALFVHPKNLINYHSLTLAALFPDPGRALIWWGRWKVNININQYFVWSCPPLKCSSRSFQFDCKLNLDYNGHLFKLQ